MEKYLMKTYSPNERIKLRDIKVVFQRKFRMEEEEALNIARYLVELDINGNMVDYDDERKITQRELI
jgi:hypothetical protein